MDVLKPYSCSLKKINAKGSLQCKDINNYLREYALSQGIGKEPQFPPKTNKQQTKKGVFLGLTPFRLQNNPSTQKPFKKIITKHEDIRSTSQTKGSTQDYTLLPIHKKITAARQTRSKFEQKMDEMMSQVIQQKQFPLEQRKTSFHRNHNNYCNIRILTEIPAQQDFYKKYSRLNEDSNIGRTITDAIHVTLNSSKTKKQKQRQQIRQYGRSQDQSRRNIGTHLNNKEAVKNQKQLQWRNPGSKYIEQKQEWAFPRVLDCRKYLKQFRVGKSSVKDLHLHKY